MVLYKTRFISMNLVTFITNNKNLKDANNKKDLEIVNKSRDSLV